MKHLSPKQAKIRRITAQRYNLIGIAMDKDLERREREARKRKVYQQLAEIHENHQRKKRKEEHRNE